MKLLLDTHILIWWDGQSRKLSAAAHAAISDPSNVVLASAVNVWEMVIKHALGKITLHTPIRKIVGDQTANGIQFLSITPAHTLDVENLLPHHKDPFDRLLIAQALAEGATIVTADNKFSLYPVPLLW